MMVDMQALVPQAYFLKLDHVGIAVPNLAEAVARYSVLLNAEPSSVCEVESQKVRTAFFAVGETHLELLEPSSDESPIAKFLQKRGPGIHHICVAVRDLDQLLEHYRASDVRLIDQTPREGAGQKRIAFVHPAATGGVLLELSESR